jgi:hypothetical protein
MSTTGNGTGGRAHTSDAGWGCMLRSAQMLLSNALLRHAATVAPGDWALPPPLPLRSHNDANAAAAAAVVTGGGTLPLLLPHLPPALLATLALFADCPGATFSVHTLCDWGARRLGKKPGEWFGPSETAWIVRHAVTAAQALPPTCAGGAALPAWLGAHALALEVAEHGTVYLDRLVKWSLGQRPERIQWERRAPLSAPACAPAPASASLSDAASLTALTAGIDPDPQPQPAAAVAAAGAGAGAGEVVAALRREAAAAAAAASAAAAAGQGPDVSHLHAHERSPASLQRPPSSYSPFPGSSAADATNSAAGAGAGAGVDAGAGWRPLLLLVPVRLGIDHVDPSYIESLLMVLCTFNLRTLSLTLDLSFLTVSSPPCPLLPYLSASTAPSSPAPSAAARGRLFSSLAPRTPASFISTRTRCSRRSRPALAPARNTRRQPRLGATSARRFSPLKSQVRAVS